MPPVSMEITLTPPKHPGIAERGEREPQMPGRCGVLNQPKCSHGLYCFPRRLCRLISAGTKAPARSGKAALCALHLLLPLKSPSSSTPQSPASFKAQSPPLWGSFSPLPLCVPGPRIAHVSFVHFSNMALDDGFRPAFWEFLVYYIPNS